MKKLSIILAALFGFLLPLHGGLTVFLSWLRYWKEILLVFLGVLVVTKEIQNFFDLDSRQSKMKSYLKTWKKTEMLALILLIWLGFLIFIDPEKIRALQATRYLALLPLVYLVFSRFLNGLTSKVQCLYFSNFVQFFCSFFLISSFISIVFGVWVKFGSGDAFVQEFYSNTVSSWVPGQTLPIWHEINGVMRMQGLASGPVAFGHLCLLGLGMLPIVLWRKLKVLSAEYEIRSKKNYVETKYFSSILVRIFVQIICSVFLLWAIWQSGSRAALLAAGLLIVWQFFWQIRDCSVRFIRTAFITVYLLALVGGGGIFYLKPNILIETLNRAGTSDHFTRPVAALSIGLNDPLTGKLGQIGPAARAWNLKKFNDDKALIAENVYIDYLAQSGVIGFMLFISFFFSAIYGATHRWRGILLVFALTICIATLIDMTPISIVLGIVLAMGNSEKTIYHCLSVSRLNKIF